MASAIYNLFRKSDPEFAAFLHHQGWSESSKRFKFYTFSRLKGVEKDAVNRQVIIRKPVWFRFHTPRHEVMDHFLAGLFHGRKLALNGFGDLKVGLVESEPSPQYTDEEAVPCYTRSPITVHRKNPDGSKWNIRPNDPDWEQAVTSNLLEKYTLFYGTPPPEGAGPLRVTVDHAYWAPKNYGFIRTGLGPERLTVFGYQCAVTLHGPAALKQFAVECGLGESTAMGFGCLEPGNPVQSIETNV
ncbi:MAG: CRISPR-associated endoribonuclease Cas6 [Bacteroidetes bacterium]|nr:CRISPR-associated endoribonuclease Cas6 [Bacteroidota bacterium]